LFIAAVVRPPNCNLNIVSLSIMKIKFATALLLSIATGTVYGQDLPAVASQVSSPAALEAVTAAVSLSTQGNELTQNQWVRMTAEGAIRGSVVSISKQAHVAQQKVRVLLTQSGQSVGEELTDVDGDFLIEGVEAGVYSLVVQAPNQLAVYALTVLDSEAGKHLPEKIEIRTIDPASPRIAELIRGNTLPTSFDIESVDMDPIAAKRMFADTCEVAIDSKGGVSGRLSRANAQVDLSKTLVYLTRDGREVLRTRAASNGQYRFEGVVPGTYGLVASGPEGIAALGFCAVAQPMASVNGSKVRLVSQDVAVSPAPIVGGVPANALNVELASPDCLVPMGSIVTEDVMVEELACAPMMGCGCGGASSGGGGGGGGIGASGGGNLGMLAAIGGLVAVGLAAALDDEEAPAVVSTIQ
jgi:hypothetical protein